MASSQVPISIARVPGPAGGPGRGRRRRGLRGLCAVVGFVLCGWCFLPALAVADALVVVEVRADGDAPEGTVTLRSRSNEGRTFQCRVEDGRCRIDEVPGGRYVVSFRSRSGASTEPRPAMIPPSGTVTLVVPVPRAD